MAYNRITWAAKVLRDAGLNVVEEPGWRDRGLSTSQPFEPEAVVWHHDASAVGDSPGVPAYMIRNMASAGAQIWVCAGCNGKHPSGTWHLVASGRMAHAGAVLPGKPGNRDSIGIETDQTVGEEWEPGLLPSLRKGTAALLRHMKKAQGALHFHKTICDPPGRKVDPYGLDLATERGRVKAEIDKLNGPPPKPVTSHTRWATKETGVFDKPGGKLLRKIPKGYSFGVIDGSGHGKDGWVQTTHGNWVDGYDTTVKEPPPEPAKPSLSVLSWNVENTGDADAKADIDEIRKMIADEKPDVVCLQEAYRLDLSGIPGYRDVYHASKGYPINSENRAQAILVRDGVSVKSKSPIVMALEWVGPKLGLKKQPRVHRYVTVIKDKTTWNVSTWHVPFGSGPVEETRKAAVNWLTTMSKSGPAIAVGDWNALASKLQAKVADPADAMADGGGKDRSVFRRCKKAKGKNLGNRKRSDHDAKKWDFIA